MPQRFDDFDLLFERQGTGYVIHLFGSNGQTTREFSLPFTTGELRDFYQRLGQRRRSRRVDSPEVAASRDFGKKLFEATFQGEMLGLLRSSTDRSRIAKRSLRLRLRLRGVPELAQLPWEFLYDSEQDHFLATSRMTPVIRYLDLPQAVSALRVRLPLKILVVICSPDNLPHLDADGEWHRLEEALEDLRSSGLVTLERQEVSTLDGLRVRASQGAFHVLHFIGHGSFDENGGYGVLHFENRMRMSHPVPGHILGNILRDHDSLRLAVLNACEGGRQSIDDSFSGVAQSLCQQRLPAAVAMQFEISDDAAKLFAYEFYKALAEGRSIEAAVALARQALFTNPFGQEWATPVLYMRSHDGVLFQVHRREAPSTSRARSIDSTTINREREDAGREIKDGAEQLDTILARAHSFRDAKDYTQARQWYEQAAAAGSADAMNNLGMLHDYGRGVQQDFTQARQWYEKATKAGSADAMNAIGCLYMNGEGVARDFDQARQWFEKGMAAGSADAMAHLGVLYEDGNGVPQDYGKSLHCYQKAAALGNADAMAGLGALYQKGQGVPKDYTQARQWFEKGAKAGSADAMTGLGVLYEFGEGVPQDYVQARKWYEESADAGDTDAMVLLGMLYENGRGVPQDYGKARHCYEKAAALGNADAMTGLGVLYQEGQGVPKDYTQARQWFEKGAASGNADAMSWLGMLYEFGEGVPQDYVQARKWYEESADAGNTDAMVLLGMLYEDGRGVPQDYGKAREWYEKSADAGSTDAMNELGRIYSKGLGVSQDDLEALEWYREAAAGGNKDAMTNLGDAFSQGKGVAQDLYEGKAWYKKAAALGSTKAEESLARLSEGDAKARQQYEVQAAAGQVDAMIALGGMYEWGRGTPQDYGKAKEWYEKAAAAGSALAMRNLSILYKKGLGVKQDEIKSKIWLEKAAASGSVLAKTSLETLKKSEEKQAQSHLGADLTRAAFYTASAAGAYLWRRKRSTKP